MILVDVNVLVYAHAESSPRHEEYRRWLDGILTGNSAYGMSSVALAGFLRVVTNPRVFRPTSRLEDALAFANALRSQPNCVSINPGSRHWDIFTRLCVQARAKANLVPDAWFAALAIESGCEWITTDRDFARFPGLQWRHPLA